MPNAKLYVASYIGPSAVLVLVYGALLYKVSRGSRFKFVITVAGLLLVSNVCTILSILTSNYNSHHDVTYFSVGLYCVSIFL